MGLCVHVILDVVNVMLDCQFTPGRALIMFLCSYLCVPSGSRDPRGVVSIGYNIYSHVQCLVIVHSETTQASAVQNANNCSAVLLHIAIVL